MNANVNEMLMVVVVVVVVVVCDSVSDQKPGNT